MKDKIVELIGANMGTLESELKAMQIIMLFNQRIVEALKKPGSGNMDQLVNDIWIPLS